MRKFLKKMKYILLTLFLILNLEIQATNEYYCSIKINGSIEQFNTKRIDLSKREIESIEYVSGCNRLIEMNLSDNNIKDIEFIYDFPRVDILILKRNNLNTINIRESLVLNSLDLSENQISNLVISPKAKLKSLFLASNQISEVQDIFENNHIEIIDLDRNKITQFLVENLYTLVKVIRLESNNLIDCGDLEKFWKLESVFLGGSPIDHCILPKNLSDLYLQNSKIKSFVDIKNTHNLSDLVLE